MPGQQSVDQQWRVSDLVAAASSEEPEQLRRYGQLPQDGWRCRSRNDASSP